MSIISAHFIIRFLYIYLSLFIWLQKYIKDFVENYKELYGEFQKVSVLEINYFLKSELLVQIIYFLIGIFIIPVIYNMIFFSSKWSATIGQKLMNICVVSKNNSKITWYQTIFRSILLMFPWFLSFIVVSNQVLASKNISVSLDDTSLSLFVLIFLGWYDLIFVTKNKLVFHDFITRTKVVIKNNDKYKPSDSIFKKLVIDGFKKCKQNIKDSINNYKKIKEEYKNKKDSQN